MQLVFLPLSAINKNNISLNLDLCFWSNCFIFIQYKLNDADYRMCVLGYTSAEHKHTINHCSYTEAARSQRQDHMSVSISIFNDGTGSSCRSDSRTARRAGP